MLGQLRILGRDAGRRIVVMRGDEDSPVLSASNRFSAPEKEGVDNVVRIIGVRRRDTAAGSQIQATSVRYHLANSQSLVKVLGTRVDAKQVAVAALCELR